MFSRHSASSLHSPRWQLTVKLSPHKNQTFISNLRCWYVLRGKNWSKRFKHQDLKEAGLKQLEWMKSIIYLFQIKMTGRRLWGKICFLPSAFFTSDPYVWNLLFWISIRRKSPKRIRSLMFVARIYIIIYVVVLSSQRYHVGECEWLDLIYNMSPTLNTTLSCKPENKE